VDLSEVHPFSHRFPPFSIKQWWDGRALLETNGEDGESSATCNFKRAVT